MKKVSVFFSLLILFFLIFFKNNDKPIKERELNVYGWYAALPRSVIQDFSKETGIKIRYDIYDNNDVLDAKLLSGTAGYDLVFPTLSPNGIRGGKLGLFKKLDLSKLKNFKNIHPPLFKAAKKLDPKIKYCLPYYWGTNGILVNMTRLKQLGLDDLPYKSLKVFYDQKTVKKLAPYGVSLLQEAPDNLPLLFRFLKRNPDDHTYEGLDIAFNELNKIRSYIKRFTSTRFKNDILLGDVIIALAYSSDILDLIDVGKTLGIDIQYYIPEEGTSLWMDGISIPRDAKNVEEAYLFMDYLLRPEVAARITDQASTTTVVMKSLKLLPRDRVSNENIFPDDKTLEKLSMDAVPDDKIYLQKRAQNWSKFLLNQ